MAKLFVSYSQKNAKTVLRVVSRLNDLGFDVWTKKSKLLGGQKVSTETAEAIAGRDIFLFFVSSSAISDESVLHEVDFALIKKKKIIPVRLEQIEYPDSLAFKLSEIIQVDYKDGSWFARLLVAMGNLSSEPNTRHTAFVSITEPKEIANSNHESVESLHQENKSTIERKSSARVRKPTKNIKESKDKLAESGEEITHAIEIFSRDFVEPAECDEVSASLRALPDTSLFKQQSLHKQFSLKNKSLTLADEINKFRAICQSGKAAQARRSILDALKTLLHSITNT